VINLELGNGGKSGRNGKGSDVEIRKSGIGNTELGIAGGNEWRKGEGEKGINLELGKDG
jgi:hypothetical protein